MFDELEEKYGEDFNWFAPLNKAIFDAELKNELISTHPLFGLPLRAVGKNERNDDMLFCDGIDFYLVHLTWSTGTKDFPRYKKISVNNIYTVLEQDYLHG